MTTGRKTVQIAGVPVPLGAVTAQSTIIITALETNTGLIYVGDKSVSAQPGSEAGLPFLFPGNSIDVVGSLATIYIDATNAGEGVTWASV